jgi:hypothetical protein
MYVPTTRERVRLRNLPGVYFVLMVDSESGTVDLLRVYKPQPRVKEGVPFSDVLPGIGGKPPDAEQPN